MLPCTFTSPPPINGVAQLTRPPFEPELGVGCYGISIIFQGLPYVVFSSYDLAHFWFFTYNIKEDAWEDPFVDFDVCSAGSLVSPQLIVSDHRLFMISWNADVPSESRSCSRLSIEEILTDCMVQEKVFQMTGELVQLVFHLPDMMASFWQLDGWAHECPGIQALGFEKSIMLMSRETGISIVYDLKLGMCSQMPTNPIQPLPSGSQQWYDKPMNLRLPNMPW